MHVYWLNTTDDDPAELASFEAAAGTRLHLVARQHLLDSSEHELTPFPRIENHGDYLFGMLFVPSDTTNTKADFDRIVAVNMKAIYLAMKEAVPRLKVKAPGAGGLRGAILNMASTAGVSPRPRLAWYNASKGWVITATRASAVELAPFGIRVNALNPVAGETPLLKTFMGEDTPEMRTKFLSTIPIGRFSTPEDLGNAACFLCSDEASMITGVCMEVDGGRCI